MSGKLLELLRLADTGVAVDIPSRCPVDQIAEACSEGYPDDLPAWTKLIQYNAQSADSLGARQLRDNGLLMIQGTKPIQWLDWPPRLRQWWRLCREAHASAQTANRAAEEQRQRAIDAEVQALALAATQTAEKLENEATSRIIALLNQRQHDAEQAAKSRAEAGCADLVAAVVRGIAALQFDRPTNPIETKKPAEVQPDTVEDEEDRVFSRTELESCFEFYDKNKRQPMSFKSQLRYLTDHKHRSLAGHGCYKVGDVMVAVVESKRPWVLFHRKKERSEMNGSGELGKAGQWGSSRY